MCAISLNDTTEIQEYADRIRKIGEDQHWSEAKYESTLGEYYFRAQKEGALQADQAEKHVRRAYELEPGNTKYLENLAGLLIWCDINIDEGMQLSKDLLKIDPDNVWNLWYLGLGYHKQGLHKEAIELLERVEDLRITYSWALQQLLREARQAYSKAGKREMSQNLLDTLETRAIKEFISFTLRGTLLAEQGYEEQEEYLLMLMHFDTLSYAGLWSHPEYMAIVGNIQP